MVVVSVPDDAKKLLGNEFVSSSCGGGWRLQCLVG